MDKPLLTKLCNAFIPNAEGNPDLLSRAASGAVARYKRRHGELWVGGKVIVRVDELQFVPNGMNVAFHSNVGALLVPFEWVRALDWEFGVLTGIVVVRCDDFDFRFRCFGAKGVVKRLDEIISSNKRVQLTCEDARG